MDILIKLILGVGLAGIVGGPYILYLAYFKPGTFPRPGLAKRQGWIAFAVGLAIFAVYFLVWR